MQKIILFLFSFSVVAFSISAKPPKKNKTAEKDPYELGEIVIKPENTITSYKPSKTRYFDLMATKLNVTPIQSNKTVIGKAELLLKPYFYEQNTLTLDAKMMVINSIELKKGNGNKKLNYSYDSLQLKIELDKTYTRDEQLTIVIDYIAQPYKLDSFLTYLGRGMYFIDAENKNPYKPFHIWTQGEEEASSVWFPTIESTNEECSLELYVTVDTAFLTMSNGVLADSKINTNGTRTDHWKQDKPLAPYLVFLGVGSYQKYATTWHGKEMSYYTFSNYFDAVPEVFKNATEMVDFYSNVLGIEYPWDKLSHMICWDYTAGAMENTSAILYFDRMLLNRQDLLDEDFDYIIVHEIFHQWFGDYVSCESWANIALNESLADYGETLWFEYKNGKDDADAYNQESMNKYINQSITNDEPIVNYHYALAHDLFDAIRYEKGGRVLHMLRNYVGDEAFYASLHKYLNDHKYSSAELSDLRQAFEAITGEDLHWFFDQWFLEKGHPILEIRHTYDEKNKTVEVRVKQTHPADQAPIYRIPTKLDIYMDGKKETKTIDITDREMAFYFPAKSKPQLVDFDADKVLLCEKIDYLSTEENIFKFYNAGLYLDKREAIAALANNVRDNPAVQEIFYKALSDKNWYLRRFTLDQVDFTDFSDKNKLMLAMQKMINADDNPQVRQKAFQLLCRMDPVRTETLCKSVIAKDSSITFIATAFDKLAAVNKAEAYKLAQNFKSTESRPLLVSLAKIFADTSLDNLEFIKKAIWMNNYRTYLPNFRSIKIYLKKCNDPLFANGIAFLADINQYEESDQNIRGAANVIYDLKTYYEERVKDKKILKEEKDSATQRLAILDKAVKNIRTLTVDFSYH